MDRLLANFETDEVRERVKNTFTGAGVSRFVAERTSKEKETVEIAAKGGGTLRCLGILSLIVTDY